MYFIYLLYLKKNIHIVQTRHTYILFSIKKPPDSQKIVKRFKAPLNLLYQKISKQFHFYYACGVRNSLAKCTKMVYCQMWEITKQNYRKDNSI